MPTLSTILSCYPILETFLSALPLGALLNLSKVNLELRIILHNFQYDPHNGGISKSPEECPDLHIQKHQTPSWVHFKSLCLLECSEPHHTKGQNPRGCRMCSMPVCEACIVKSSFGKKENTFQTRRRYLCKECWISGNPHVGQIPPSGSLALEYERSELCRCTAKDGTLCLRCKDQQNLEAEQKHAHCAGTGCSNEVDERNSAGRICLWCSCVLPGQRSMEESYKIYDSRYLFKSRRSSSPEKLPETSMAPFSRRMHFEDQKWDFALKAPEERDQKRDLVSKAITMDKANPPSKSGREELSLPILPTFSREHCSDSGNAEGSGTSQEASGENRRNIPDIGDDQCPQYESRPGTPPSRRNTLDDDGATLGDQEWGDTHFLDEDEITLMNREY